MDKIYKLILRNTHNSKIITSYFVLHPTLFTYYWHIIYALQILHPVIVLYYLLNLLVILSNIIANDPFPNTLHVVIIGSNSMYRAVTIPNISGDI